jgi:transposase
MDKTIEKLGIDVSKDTFNTYSPGFGHKQYGNNAEGWNELQQDLENTRVHAVMEATGTYHHRLAMELYRLGHQVSVVNPLVIKRYIQMKLQRNKTDKSDAYMIWQYAEDQQPSIWHPESAYLRECKDCLSTIELYTRQSTMLKNRLHSMEAKGVRTGKVLTSIKRQIRQIKKELQLLEQELEELIKNHQQSLLTDLRSIPGIGKKTAMLLIAVTNGFQDFESAKQVSAYFGLAPTERTSGTSIRGKHYISKRGNPIIRNHLFLCSFTACQCNPQYKALYERLVNKGKSKKLALMIGFPRLLM